MITEEKIKSIQKRLKKGEPQGEIKNELRADGYSEEDMEKIFVPHKPDMRSWYLVSAILFLLIGFYMLLVNESLHFLIYSGAMFIIYYKETEKHKKQSS